MARGTGNGSGRPARTELTAQQQAAAEHIVATGLGHLAAANHVGVTHQAVSQWRKLPLFDAYVKQLQEAKGEDCWDRLRAASTDAVETLVAVMRDTTERGSVRMAAANSVLDRLGFVAVEKSEVLVDVAQPFGSREEMLAALRGLPKDMLVELGLEQ